MNKIMSRGGRSSASSEAVGTKVYLSHDYNAPQDEQYVLFTEADFPSVPTPYLTAEHICLKVAQKLNISPSGLSLFALRPKSRNGWFAPTYQVEYRSDKLCEFLFSIRFVPPVGDGAEGLLRLTSDRFITVLNYLYLQCRADFLENHIENMKHDRQLGFGVVDMVRYIRENNLSPSAVKKLDPSQFLPSMVTRVSLFKKHRLINNMRTSVHQELADTTNDTIQSMKLRFIVGIKKEYPFFSREEFQASGGDVAIVDPYCARFPGLSFRKHGRDESFATIEELDRINIEHNDRSTRMMISRNTGQPQVLSMTSLSVAESLAALLCGYHRLMVDYHTILCDEVAPQSQLDLQKLKCYGPVRPNWAEDKLMERHRGNKQINYLLKQKSDIYDQYRLFYINVEDGVEHFEGHTDPKIHMYDIIKVANGNWQLQLHTNRDGKNPEFTSLQHLKEKCNQEGILHLYSIARPELPDDKHLLVCRTLDPPKLDAQTVPLPARQQTAQVILVSHVDISKRQIGVGRFTEVHLGFWERNSHSTSEKELVAVKQARVSNDSTLSLLRAIHQTAFWCHPTIVRVQAICLEPPFRALLEYCRHGQLEAWLMQDRMGTGRGAIQLAHLLLAAEQIAQALHYLQNKPSSKGGRGEVHGNLRCGNIMVYAFSSNSLLVKLADPGFIHMYNALAMEHECNRLRLPWIAPELYKDLKQMTLYSDIYAFGITLHELFSFGERPYRFKEHKELFNALSNKRSVELHRPALCPDQVMELINNCKKIKQDERPSTSEILRTIRTTIQETDSCGFAINDYSRVGQSVPRGGDYHSGTQVAVGMKGQLMQGGSRDPLLTPSTSISNLSANSRICEGSSMTESTTDYYPQSDTTAAVSVHHSRPLPVVPTVPHLPEEIDRNFLHEIEGGTLGEGNYGKVVRMEWTRIENGTQCKQLVAVKMLKDVSSYEAMAELEKEFDIMCKLDHANVVSILGQSPKLSADEPMLLVMEYISKGSLNQHLKNYNNGPNHIRENTLLQYCKEIAQGMCYLHDKKIVHRDLATRNVLVTHDEHMKISDFGLSRMLGEKDYYRLLKGRGIPALWYAPEALDEKLFTISSDVWSFGVTMWEIHSYANSPKLCEQVNQMIPRLHRGERLKQPARCSDQVYGIMMMCWEYNHLKRAGMREVLDSIHNLEVAVINAVDRGAQCEAAPNSIVDTLVPGMVAKN